MIVYSVQKVSKGFFMVFAEEDKAGVGRKSKRLFVESEIFCVHKWIPWVLLQDMILQLYISHIQIIFKQNQVDSAYRRLCAASEQQASDI
jgi:hypothetical protein